MWLTLNDGKKQLTQLNVFCSSIPLYSLLFILANIPLQCFPPHCVFFRQWKRSVLESGRSEDVDERRTVRNMETNTGNKTSALAERQYLNIVH